MYLAKQGAKFACLQYLMLIMNKGLSLSLHVLSPSGCMERQWGSCIAGQPARLRADRSQTKRWWILPALQKAIQHMWSPRLPHRGGKILYFKTTTSVFWLEDWHLRTTCLQHHSSNDYAGKPLMRSSIFDLTINPSVKSTQIYFLWGRFNGTFDITSSFTVALMLLRKKI